MPRNGSVQPASRFHVSGQTRVRLGHEYFHGGKCGSDANAHGRSQLSATAHHVKVS